MRQRRLERLHLEVTTRKYTPVHARFYVCARTCTFFYFFFFLQKKCNKEKCTPRTNIYWYAYSGTWVVLEVRQWLDAGVKRQTIGPFVIVQQSVTDI